MQIAVLLESLDIMARSLLEAIYRFGKAHEWNVCLIEAPDGRARTSWSVPGWRQDCTLREAIRYVRPDGIVSIGSDLTLLRDRSFRGIPIVTTGNDTSPVRGIPCVRCDNDDIVQVGARELFRSGWRDFAFAGWTMEKSWSRAREIAFRMQVLERGSAYHVLDVASLSEGLSRLPRRCGIFAANDLVGAKVISAARHLGFRVPEDFAVIGVDNDLQVCENAPVTLTSVEQNTALCGRRAAETLQRMLTGQDIQSAQLRFGALTLVRRASTRFFLTDCRVSRALEYIRLHVAEGVTVEAVAMQMGCSRNMADLLFKRQCHMTVHAAIVDERLRKVKELLSRPSQGLSSLHDFCGFASADDLRRVFRRETGMTLTAWRRSL